MESDELGILSATLEVVYDDLEVVQSEGTSSLVACAIEIMARVHQLRGMPFVLGSISPSRLLILIMGTASETTSHGFTPGFEVHELEEMEAAVAPLS